MYFRRDDGVMAIPYNETDGEKCDNPQVSQSNPLEHQQHPQANSHAYQFEGSPDEFPDQCGPEGLPFLGGNHRTCLSLVVVIQQICLVLGEERNE